MNMEKRLVEKMTSQYFPCAIFCSPHISCRSSLMSFPVKTHFTLQDFIVAQIFSLLINFQALVLFSNCVLLHFITLHYMVVTHVNEH